MASVYQSCTSPFDIVVTYPAAGQIRVQWQGAAATYKLAYKREEETAWNIYSTTGPGSVGGSGLITDDTGGTIIPTAAQPSADFLLSGLTPGIYDLRLINKCGDNTDFFTKRKEIISVPTGMIPDFKLVNQGQSRLQFIFSWGTPTIDNTNPIFFSWCTLDERGRSIDCDNDELPYTARSYKLEFPEGKILRVFVSKMINAYDAAFSDYLIIDTEKMTCCVPGGTPTVITTTQPLI